MKEGIFADRDAVAGSIVLTANLNRLASESLGGGHSRLCSAWILAEPPFTAINRAGIGIHQAPFGATCAASRYLQELGRHRQAHGCTLNETFLDRKEPV
jgi:hypothetical protein